MLTIRAGVVLLLAGAALAAHGPAAFAQDFPTKPIRLVVPNGTGAPQDTIARTFGPELAKILGQPVVVENRPGAGQLLGHEYVAKQVPADGHTLVLGLVDSQAILPVTVKDLRVDFVKDLAPITNVASGRLVLAIAAKQPWANFNDVMASAKANPGRLNYSYMSQTTSFLLEVVLRDRGLKVEAIPYGGNMGNYFQSMKEGSVQMTLISEATAAAVLGDTVRIVATTGDTRIPTMPDVPTFAELGYPQIVGFTFSLSAPAATPKPVLAKLNAAAARALQQPATREVIAKVKMEPARDTSPEAAMKLLTELAKTFADIAKATNFQPQ